jgi:hypothetical protein
LLIKEVLVGDDTIVIRHCIPVPSAPPDGSDSPPPIRSDEAGVDRSYLLRSGSDPAVACALISFMPIPDTCGDQVAEARAFPMEQGHTRGKIVITMRE